MSNVPITGLPTATYLSPTGVLPVVRSGVTYQITNANLLRYVTPEQYGCVGDGVTDDTTNFGTFLDNANNSICLLTGTYKLASLLSKALSNTLFLGIPGKTKITGSFGYAILRLLTLSNVHFDGITFETTYASAVEDTGAGIVYSFQSSVTNASFRRCKFTGTSANTNGLSVYARITSGDTSATIDGLVVEYCDFTDVGRMGVLLMNRFTGSGKNDKAKHCYINNNRATNLGTQGSHGFFISLDGFGSDFTIDHNLIQDPLGTGIENTGWSYGSISYNSFRDFTNASTSAFSINGTGNGVMTGLNVIGNKTLEASTTHSFIGLMDASYVAGNYIEVTSAASQAMFIRDSNDNKFVGNYWKALATYSVYAEYGSTTCKRNKFIGDTFDNAGSSSQTSAFRFSGSGCSENELLDCTFKKGTGGTNYDEALTASNNVARLANTSTNLYFTGFAAPSYSVDANKTLTIAELADVIQIGDSVGLSTGRDLIFPNWTRSWIVRNATAQTITCIGTSGTGIAIATGKTAVIHWNTVNMARDTADV